MKAGSSDEMFRSRLSIPNEAEQEERRMSDLSDWASSVTSATDLQVRVTVVYVVFTYNPCCLNSSLYLSSRVKSLTFRHGYEL